MSNTWGGKRPGAGRPPGTLSEENKRRARMKARWLERIDKEADSFFDAQRELALGYYKEVKTPQGNVKVYKKAPNPFALEWIFEHVWGKAPQKIDLDAEIRGDFVITNETEAALRAAIQHAIPRHDYEHPSDPESARDESVVPEISEEHQGGGESHNP